MSHNNDEPTDPFPASTDIFTTTPTTQFTARLHTTAPRTLVNSIPMDGTAFIAPFVPCTLATALDALHFASYNPTLDVLCDLGCGDGRVLTQALDCFPCPDGGVQRRRVVGCELDPFLADHLRSVVATRYADGVLHVIEGDMFAVDLEAVRVDLFVLYLLPLGLGKLKGQLRRWLEGGGNGEGEGEGRRKRRIVTITYSIPGWECDRAIEVGDTVKQWLFYYDLKDVRDE